MGIYDRDYEREHNYDESSGFHLGGGARSLTTNLVIVMAIVYVVQLLTRGANDTGWFTRTFSLDADMPRQPWMAFQLITYGFLHDPDDLRHIAFNCFGLWMFGRIVEQRTGRREFLAYFLAAVAFAGVTWLASEFVAFRQLVPNASLLGASGGIAAVLVLFCLYFPHQTIFLGFLFPIPAWVFAIFFVGQDILFAVRNNPSDNVAYTAHIGGALFAFLYYKSGMRLSNYLPGQFKLPKLGRRPPLRVHTPPEDADDTEDAVDHILRKIREHGQDSLTRQERRILEEASREYQKRRH
ncbi:MAG: rhomboid family intramembrane serine protease [Pirellulales bacterium]